MSRQDFTLAVPASRGASLSKNLIIGYGNPDREDDGVAWHILKSLALHFGCGDPNTFNGNLFDIDLCAPQHRDDVPDLQLELQLMPEVSETLAEYDKVCFVDAHTGALAHDLNVEHIAPRAQNSPFTHHLTPEMCLHLAQTAFGRAPKAITVSVRGYKFGFVHALSPQTAQLADEAVQTIIAWIKE